jgi:hypothetical protein
MPYDTVEGGGRTKVSEARSGLSHIAEEGRCMFIKECDE